MKNYGDIEEGVIRRGRFTMRKRCSIPRFDRC